MWKRGGGGREEGGGRRREDVHMCVWVCDSEGCMEERFSTVCETERDGFRIQIALPSASQGFSSVSAPSVFLLFRNWCKANRFTVTTRPRVLQSVCVCLSHARVHATCRYVWEKSGSVIDVSASPRLRQDPDGTLHISQTWSGDIGTYTCRVTSVGGNDSRSAHLRVRYAYLSLPSYLAAVFSLRIYVTPGRDGWMFSPLFVVYHHSPL